MLNVDARRPVPGCVADHRVPPVRAFISRPPLFRRSSRVFEHRLGPRCDAGEPVEHLSEAIRERSYALVLMAKIGVAAIGPESRTAYSMLAIGGCVDKSCPMPDAAEVGLLVRELDTGVIIGTRAILELRYSIGSPSDWRRELLARRELSGRERRSPGWSSKAGGVSEMNASSSGAATFHTGGSPAPSESRPTGLASMWR